MIIYQKNKELLPEIQKDGCYLLCYLYLAGFDDAKKINEVYLDLVGKKIILKDCYIINSRVLVQYLGIGKDVTYREVNYLPNDMEKTIGCYFNPRTKYTHFVIIDNKTREIIYDPLEGKSITVKEGYLDSMRVIS